MRCARCWFIAFALAVLLFGAAFCTLAQSATATQVLQWDPSPAAVTYRLYRRVCQWAIAPESTETRAVEIRSCAWLLHAEGPEPRFTIHPLFTRADWLAANVAQDGTETRRTTLGWWTEP
jgi:hypothetical protein